MAETGPGSLSAMNLDWKQPARLLIPEAWRQWWRLKFGWRWFRGDYDTWASARIQATGFEDSRILDRVLAATLRVRDGQAAYERDGITFVKAQQDEMLLDALKHVRNECSGRLRVLDFGGSLGSTYWRHRHDFDHNQDFSWAVVEQLGFVVAGRKHLSKSALRFYPNVAEAVAAGSYDVLLCSTALQYLESPNEALADWMTAGWPFILLNNLPLHESGPDRIRVQHVPPEIYPASYPVWFFNRRDFLRRVEPHYRLVKEFASEAVWPVDGKLYPSTGLLLQRRTRL
jgi:putative methyltransferase (TIGR04325 family)